MLFILEGSDGSGKTTMAGALEDAYRLHYPQGEVLRLKAGPPDPPDRNAVEEYELGLLRQLPDNPASLVVCDRWNLGEMIYGPLLRQNRRLSRGQELHVEMFLQSLGAVKSVLSPKWDDVVKRFRKRGDDLIDETDLIHVYQWYRRAAQKYCYGIVQHSLPPPEWLRAKLTFAMSQSTLAARVSSVAPGYTGTLMPLRVLAGDVRSPKHQDPEHEKAGWVHAFTPAQNGCAMWMLDRMADWPSEVLRTTGMLNTGEPGMDLAQADQVLAKPRWVALGSVASIRLTEAGIPHLPMPHPQYVKRFKKNDETFDSYVRDLLDA